MGASRRVSSSAELDVGPMVGVLLVLLIVVMTALPTMTTIDVALWSPMSPDVACNCDGVPVVLEVRPGPSYRVDDEPVEPARLLVHLSRINRARPRQELVVEGYPGASYGDVVTAIDIAKSAGVRGIDIPPRETYLPVR